MAGKFIKTCMAHFFALGSFISQITWGSGQGGGTQVMVKAFDFVRYIMQESCEDTGLCGSGQTVQ
jgi:hypothetical protein